MGTGIQICGFNGSGKSTLGRALAERLDFYFIDNEHLYFSRTNPDESYTNPRTREEAEALLMREVRRHPDFVFAAVRGDYGGEILPLYCCAVVVEVPREICMQRIRSRSFQKFGCRMLPGGELYEREEAFFQMAERRTDDYVETWLQKLKCPVIRVDGTRPVQENVEYLVKRIADTIK